MYFLDIYNQLRQVQRVRSFADSNSISSPLLLTNIMQSWEAYPKWNLGYLQKHFGTYKISASRFQEGKEAFIHVVLSNFIAYAQSSEEYNPYYATTTLHLCDAMKDKYPISSEFSCWYKNFHETTQQKQSIELSCLYFGPRNSRSRLHIDIWGTSFWNALFEGRKFWIFVPSEQVPIIYGGEVDPFFPDFREYPNFQYLDPIVCIQEPGEVIYCPGNMWHAAFALEPSVALSENFINEHDYQNVLTHFEDARYYQALKKMKMIVEMNLNSPKDDK